MLNMSINIFFVYIQQELQRIEIMNYAMQKCKQNCESLSEFEFP